MKRLVLAWKKQHKMQNQVLVVACNIYGSFEQEVSVSLPASTTIKALHRLLTAELGPPPTPGHSLHIINVKIDDSTLSTVWPQSTTVTLSCRWDAYAVPYPLTRNQDQATLATLADDVQRPRRQRMPTELQVMLDPNRHVDNITPFTEGIYAWVADQGEWSHVKWLVEAPQGCPFEGCVFVVQTYLPYNYPYAMPHMRVLTPMHHPLVLGPDGSLLLWQDQGLFLPDRWTPRGSVVQLLQMFRQQLKMEKLGSWWDPVITVLPQLEAAIGLWQTDTKGQLKKARAMAACFARPMARVQELSRRELRGWAVVIKGACAQEVSALLMVVDLHRRTRLMDDGDKDKSGSIPHKELGDLPQELIELIIDRVIMLHIKEEATSTGLVVPSDWKSRVITSWPPHTTS